MQESLTSKYNKLLSFRHENALIRIYGCCVIQGPTLGQIMGVVCNRMSAQAQTRRKKAACSLRRNLN